MKLSTAAKTNLILASLMGAILVAAANVGVPPIPYQTEYKKAWGVS